MLQGHTKAEWFEHDAHRLGSIVPPSKAPLRVDTARELRDNGLRTGIEAVKLARQVSKGHGQVITEGHGRYEIVIILNLLPTLSHRLG